MSDVSAVARLRLAIEGAQDIINELSRVREAGDDVGPAAERLEKVFVNISKAAGELGGSLGGAAGSLRESGQAAKGAAEGWDEYSKALTEANKANREAAQSRVMSSFSADDIPAVSAAEMTPEQRKNVLDTYGASTASIIADIKQIEAAEREAAKATEDWAEAFRRLEAVQRASTQADTVDRWNQEQAATEASRKEMEDWTEAARRLEAVQRASAQADTIDRWNQERAATEASRKEMEDWTEAARRLEAAQRASAQADTVDRWNQERAATEASRKEMEDWTEAARRLEAVQRASAQADTVDRWNQERAATEAARKELEAMAKAQAEYNQRVSQPGAQGRGAAAFIDARSGGPGGMTAAIAEYDAQVRKLADDSSPRLRYALYDVGRTASVASAALTAAGVGATVLSANFESAFTKVERTSGATGAAAGQLREELMQLSREIPQSFGDIADLAARGAQLGVATSNLGSFTETVAQFVATSDTVTLDQAVEAFGRISNLMGDTQFNRIGSAITLVGVNAAATEAQIVKTTQELAPFATAVGISTDEVIGLATAVASLGQPPERARSAFLTLQRVVDGAVAGMNDKLSAFAHLLGMTEEEAARLWKTDPSAFITSFVRSLGTVENLTTAFDDLGISERRAVQVFQALAADSRNAGDGMSVLERAMADANQGYEEGTEMARQYGLILDDLASKWQIFVNALAEAGAAVGDVIAPVAKAALDALSGLFQQLAQAARSDFGKWAIGIATAIGGIVAALAALTATLAFAGGSLFALRLAATQLGIVAVGATTGLRGMAAAALGLGTQVGMSAAAVSRFRIALASTGIGLAVVALGSLAAAFMAAGDAADAAFQKFIGTTGGLAEAVAADTEAYVEEFGSAIPTIASGYREISLAVDENTAAQDDNQAAIAGTADLLGITPSAFGVANEALKENTAYLGENTAAWIRNSLMQNEAFREMAGNQELANYMDAIGADMDHALLLAATRGEQAFYNYLYSLQESAIEAGKNIDRILQRFQGGLVPVTTSSSDGLFTRIFGGGDTAGASLKAVAQIGAQTGANIRLLGLTGEKAGAQLTDAFEESVEAAENLARSVGGGGGGGRGGKSAADAVRTLVDYARDLGGVFSRAFDLRFGRQQGLDSITSGWSEIAKAADEAREAAAEYRAELEDLSADRAIKEYWLTVAEGYGDTLRATKLRAELAALDKKQTDTQKKLNAEQDKTNKTLEGNSDIAIANRAELLGLVGSYQDYIETLAESGMSQEELQRESQRLRAEFVEQATRMGYNRNEVERYARAFDDMTYSIQRVPRNITVDANTNPAQQALNEYLARVNNSTATVGVRAAPGGGGLGENAATDFKHGFERQMARNPIAIRGVLHQGHQVYQVPGTQLRLFKSGGYTGDAPTNQITGAVHGREFVMSAPAVRNAGGPNAMAYMHNALKSGKGLGAVGLGAGSPSVVDLSAGSARMIADMLSHNLKVILPGAQLAGSVGSHNIVAAGRGAS